MMESRDMVEESQIAAACERQEARYPVNKKIRIEVAGVMMEVLLVNVSLHGFCIRATRGGLRRGQPVRLRYPWGEVEARVVWARDAEDYCEGGLFVP